MKTKFALLITLLFCFTVVNGLEDILNVRITPTTDVLQTYPGKFNDIGVLMVNYSFKELKPVLTINFDETKFYLPANLEKEMEVTDKPLHLSIVTRKNSSLGESIITISIRPKDIPNLVLWEDSITVQIQENPKIKFSCDYLVPGEEEKINNKKVLITPEKSLSILFIGYKSEDLEVIPSEKIRNYVKVHKEGLSYQGNPVTVCKIVASHPVVFSPISGKIDFMYKKVHLLAFYPEIPVFFDPAIVLYGSLLFLGILLLFFGREKIFKANYLRVGSILMNNLKDLKGKFKHIKSFKEVFGKKREGRKISREKRRITHLLKVLDSDLKKGKITQKAYEELYTEYKTALINLEEEEIKLKDQIARLKHEEEKLKVELEKLEALNRLKGVKDYEYKRSKIQNKLKAISKEIDEKSNML
ncbi:MAG: hypothetical protein ACE5K4_02135 [Candidatus Hydrothermarchaeota archaeon]